jgi:methionine biosynthesis protein MetW
MLKKIIDEVFRYRPYRIGDMDYEKYWDYRKNTGKKGLKPRDFVIANLIKDGSSVLDIGCGNGRLLEFLINEKGVTGYGIDNSDTALDIVKEKGITAYKCDLSNGNIPINQTYDYIVMSEIIEHLPDSEKLMKSVQDMFSESLIVTFPNIGHFTYRLRLLSGRFPECWKWHPGEHVRFWTKKDFKYWVDRQDNGFENLYIKKMIPGEKMPNIPLLSSWVSFNYIAELGNKNVREKN